MTSTSKSSPHERAAALVDAALALQQAGDWDEALHTLTRAQALAPDYTPLHMLVGLIYQEQQRWEEAEARFRRVLELEPDHSDALQTLGLLLVKQGRADDGLGMLRKHLALKPADPTTLKAIAGELLSTKNPDEAIQLYSQAWQSTHSADIGLAYGRLLLRAGRPDQAEPILRAVVDNVPTSQSVLELGNALLILGRGAEAVEVLTKASLLDPTSALIWRALSAAYLVTGQLPEALEAAERLLALDSEDCRNWVPKANVLFLLQRYDDLLEATRRGRGCSSTGEDPQTAQYLLLMEGRALEALERFAEAHRVFAAARASFPANEDFLRHEARALNRLGRAVDALQLIQAAQATGVRGTGNLAPVHFETLHRLGRADEAWDFIAPLLKDKTERRLDTLGNVGLTLYGDGEVGAARLVFEQLAAFVARPSRFSINLGFILTGNGELAEAQRLFEEAAKSDAEPDLRALILVDLGYVYLIQQDLIRASEMLAGATAVAGKDDVAILRVAYWRPAAIHPDDVRHPTEFVSIRAAALANQVTLNLARHQMAEAEELAKQVMAEFPHFAPGFLVAGCERLAAGDKQTARQYWQQALELSKDSRRHKAIAAWLAELTD